MRYNSLFKTGINIGLILVVGSLIVLNSCGKVTQQMSAPEPHKSFKLTVQIPILTTGDIQIRQQSNYRFPSSNYVITLDKDVYAVVYGVRHDGKRDELSWGHGVLSEKEPLESDRIKTVGSLSSTNNTVTSSNTSGKNVSKNNSKKPTLTEYKSVSYRKDNLKLVRADFRWGVLNIKNGTPYKWEFKAEKVKRGYAYYIVYFYKNDSTYFANVVDAAAVSGNQMVVMPEMTKYSTFLTQLLLMEMKENPDVSKDLYWQQDVEEIFSQSFFEALYFKDMSNLVKTFKVKNPIFKFNRKFEQELLKLMRIVLLDSDERYEALDYIKKLPKAVMSKDAIQILEKNIRSFVNKRLEEEEESDYYYEADSDSSEDDSDLAPNN